MILGPGLNTENPATTWSFCIQQTENKKSDLLFRLRMLLLKDKNKSPDGVEYYNGT